uniref:Uncharacterized protein n=1 Tax=Arion vulgaris TaxID=1028688 RepID=A0A0B7AMX6_9EUPU
MSPEYVYLRNNLIREVSNKTHMRKNILDTENTILLENEVQTYATSWVESDSVSQKIMIEGCHV